jgi:hypothetical protein
VTVIQLSPLLAWLSAALLLAAAVAWWKLRPIAAAIAIGGLLFA